MRNYQDEINKAKRGKLVEMERMTLVVMNCQLLKEDEKHTNKLGILIADFRK